MKSRYRSLVIDPGAASSLTASGGSQPSSRCRGSASPTGPHPPSNEVTPTAYKPRRATRRPSTYSRRHRLTTGRLGPLLATLRVGGGGCFRARPPAPPGLRRLDNSHDARPVVVCQVRARPDDAGEPRIDRLLSATKWQSNGNLLPCLQQTASVTLRNGGRFTVCSSVRLGSRSRGWNPPRR
jgi:hypothetical protein